MSLTIIHHAKDKPNTSIDLARLLSAIRPCDGLQFSGVMTATACELPEKDGWFATVFDLQDESFHSDDLFLVFEGARKDALLSLELDAVVRAHIAVTGCFVTEMYATAIGLTVVLGNAAPYIRERLAKRRRESLGGNDD